MNTTRVIRRFGPCLTLVNESQEKMERLVDRGSRVNDTTSAMVRRLTLPGPKQLTLMNPAGPRLNLSNFEEEQRSLMSS